MNKNNRGLLYLIGFPVLSAALVFIAYFLLSCGRVAQGTYNYSVLKEFETTGYLTTNVYFITTGTNTHAASLIHLELVKQFNGLAMGVVIVLALISTLVVWRLIFRLKAERVISENSSEIKNRDRKT
jgi:hypothetical protein